MINDDAFNEVVNEIVAQGYDEATAAYFARLIGDTPIVDQAGNVLVKEGKKLLAKLKLACLSKKQ